METKKKTTGLLEDAGLNSFLLLLRRRALFLVFCCAVSSAFVAWEHKKFPSYRSGSVIYFQSVDNPLQAMTAKLSGDITRQSNEFPEKYLQHLNSYTFALEVAKVIKESKEFEAIPKKVFFEREHLSAWLVDLMLFRKTVPTDDPEIHIEQIADALMYWVSIARADTDGVNVTVNTPDAKLSTLIANMTSVAAVASISKKNLKELDDAVLYLNQQIEYTEKKLKESEDEIIEFRKNNRSVASQSSPSFGGSSADLSGQIEELEVEIDHSNRIYTSLKKKIEARGAHADAEDSLDNKFGLSRKVQDAKDKLDSLRERKKSFVAELKRIDKSQNPYSEQTLFDLKKRMEMEYAHFQDLRRQTFQVEMQKIAAANKVYASPPVRETDVGRTSSLSKKLAFALLFSGIVGIILARLKDELDPVISSRQELERLGVRYLGGIPECAQGDFTQDFDIIQALKQIRTRILYALSDNDAGMVIGILSPGERDGKSFLARNLVNSFVRLGRRVLIIDADLEGGVKNREGLIEVLAGQRKFSEVYQKDFYPGADFLPPGATRFDSADLVTSTGMSNLIKDLKQIYSVVIIDTPPFSQSMDCVLLAEFCDIPVVVASSNSTDASELANLIELTGENGREVYGVFNREPPGLMKEVRLRWFDILHLLRLRKGA